MKNLIEFRVKIIPFILIAFGLAFAGLSIFSMVSTKDYDGRTTAKIVDIVETQEMVNEADGSNTVETVYTRYISFKAGGKRFNNVEFGTCGSSTKIGDTVEIVYDRDNPEHYKEAGNKTPMVVGGVGVVVFIAGIVMLVKKPKEQSGE